MKLTKISFALVGVVFLLGTSCAGPGLKSAHHSTLKGAEDLVSSIIKEEEGLLFRQEGLASWYGPGFYGRKTANGTRFKKEALTCAHRTLPFGTRLIVTNPNTGQSVEVLVNDRGPYIPPRIIDLSYAAARQIGLLKSGVMTVTLVEKVKDAPQYSQLSSRTGP